MIAAMTVCASSKSMYRETANAEKVALFLTMNYRDNSCAVLLFNRPDRLGTSYCVPLPHEQRLQRHDRNEDEEY